MNDQMKKALELALKSLQAKDRADAEDHLEYAAYVAGPRRAEMRTIIDTLLSQDCDAAARMVMEVLA